MAGSAKPQNRFHNEGLTFLGSHGVSMIFENFDFSVLENPEFKEDSVREELIVPLVKFLGYKASGSSRVVRSMPLQHMFVSIGSKKNRISIIPDYVFYDDNKPYWVLDAKAPWEDITKTNHVEQAYSYAIHPDIRAELFALCNGKVLIGHPP